MMDAIERRPGVPTSIALRALGLAIAVVFVAPAVFVVSRAVVLDGGSATTARELLGPLWRTIQLAALVSVSAAVIGTSLAWLLVRTDLPGRQVWRVVLVLPLVLPSFVGAAAFIAGLAPTGVVHGVLDVVGVTPPRRFRGLGASWLVLTAFTYPYVLLPVSARLIGMRRGLEESARLLGQSAWSTFRRVTLPHLRASIFGGTLLVFLYTVSEFGAVQLLGYDTLTRVVFSTRQVDRATSFASAATVAILATAVVIAERRFRGPVTADDDASVVAARAHLGWRAIPATLLCLVVALVGLVAPLASLATWAQRGIAAGRVDLWELSDPARNTAWVGVVAAVAAVIVVLPVAVATVRRPHPTSSLAAVAIAGGFAIPGLVVALSLASLTLNTPVLVGLYQSMTLLIVAYVVHFGVQALASTEQAVRTVPAALAESSKLLDRSRLRRLVRIDLPLMRPGLLAGGGLVLLSAVKELPATLLLSPIGFSTLSTTIWSSYEEGFYADVGAASLALVAVSALLTWVLVLRRSAIIAG